MVKVNLCAGLFTQKSPIFKSLQNLSLLINNSIQLNNFMWIDELGELYLEGRSDMRNPEPYGGSGKYRPVETRDSVWMRSVGFNKGGDGENSVNVSPTLALPEQEEGPEEMIDKREVYAKINQLLDDLDNHNPIDRSAILVLSTLKNMLK